MQWYLKALKQYVDFSGRARRTEFWMFVLVNAVVAVLLIVLSLATGLAGASADDGMATFSFGPLLTIYQLAVLLPSIAVTVRRLHDTDRSGWWYLIGLVPLVGAIVLIVFTATEGDRGPNRFGADPKETLMADQPGPAMPV